MTISQYSLAYQSNHSSSQKQQSPQETHLVSEKLPNKCGISQQLDWCTVPIPIDCSFLTQTNSLSHKTKNYWKNSSVTVTIESIALSFITDKKIRNTQSSLFKCTFVGIVHSCESGAEELGIRVGERVVSIVKRRLNRLKQTRLVILPAEQLSIVSTQLDAADVAVVAANYLPAFQALHQEQSTDIASRYSRTAFRGKKILVTGELTNYEGQAALHLARWTGAEAYVSETSSYDSHVLKSLSFVHILPENMNMNTIEESKRMDIVIDYDFPNRFDETRTWVAEHGRHVCIHRHRLFAKNEGWINGLRAHFVRWKISLIQPALLFNFDDNFQFDPVRVGSDLQFLLELLLTRQIRPQIDRYIKFRDIPRIQSDLESTPLMGSIICEPYHAS